MLRHVLRHLDLWEVLLIVLIFALFMAALALAHC
jgi:hypothetical protein